MLNLDGNQVVANCIKDENGNMQVNIPIVQKFQSL